jgi:hypothetical protein
MSKASITTSLSEVWARHVGERPHVRENEGRASQLVDRVHREPNTARTGRGYLRAVCGDLRTKRPTVNPRVPDSELKITPTLSAFKPSSRTGGRSASTRNQCPYGGSLR